MTDLETLCHYFDDVPPKTPEQAAQLPRDSAARRYAADALYLALAPDTSKADKATILRLGVQAAAGRAAVEKWTGPLTEPGTPRPVGHALSVYLGLRRSEIG